MSREKKICILGGGLAGLSLRYFLKHPTEIVEKESECGGLCRSIKENGFTFDQGGHILFSKSQYISNLIKKILRNNVERKRRNNKVYYNGRFIKYPFENGLSGLSKKDNFECLYYYLKNDTPKPTNFKEWLYRTFGKGIAEKYLVPYNKKIWKFDLGKMDLGWVERIPKPPLEDIIKSSLGIKTEGYLHQLFYLYPRYGGIQSLTNVLEMAKDEPIITNFTVKKIVKKGDKWEISNTNESRVSDKLISTIPIFDLIGCMVSVPKKVLDALVKLKYNSLVLIMLGLNKGDICDYPAIYFSDKDSVYHRICFMNNFSKSNAPRGKGAIIAEITTRQNDDIWNMQDRILIDNVVNGLDMQKIIDKKIVNFSKVHRVKYAYVIYDLEYEKNIKIVKKYVDDQGIILLGRFAEFEYINMDEVINRSIKLASKLN